MKPKILIFFVILILSQVTSLYIYPGNSETILVTITNNFGNIENAYFWTEVNDSLGGVSCLVNNSQNFTMNLPYLSSNEVNLSIEIYPSAEPRDVSCLVKTNYTEIEITQRHSHSLPTIQSITTTSTTQAPTTTPTTVYIPRQTTTTTIKENETTTTLTENTTLTTQETTTTVQVPTTTPPLHPLVVLCLILTAMFAGIFVFGVWIK